jgi:HEPN domain-containing protein
MKATSAEWVAKAEADFRVASRESRVSEEPSFDGVCFHSQQCVEKYLKGYLESIGSEYPKTHELTILLDLCIASQPLWEAWRRSFRVLSDFAVEYRYPGQSADQQDARFALDVCSKFRSEARIAFIDNA